LAYEVNKGFDINLKYGNNDGMATKDEIKKGIQIYIDRGKENLWHHPVDNPQLRLSRFLFYPQH